MNEIEQLNKRLDEMQLKLEEYFDTLQQQQQIIMAVILHTDIKKHLSEENLEKVKQIANNGFS